MAGERTINNLKINSPTEVRQDRQQRELLPGLCPSFVVDHEGIEVVGDVADTDIDLVVQFTGGEGKLVSEVKPQDHRHVVVVDA